MNMRIGMGVTLVTLAVVVCACGDDDDDSMTSAGSGASSAGKGSSSAGKGGSAGSMADAGAQPKPKDPAKADLAEIDRFSKDAGMLMMRTADNGLPKAGEAIDFDQGPFITQGLSPDGTMSVRYYNFDVQPTKPAPIYALFREGEDTPVDGQLNIVDVIPGDPGYNDFWQVHKVTVPKDYVANTLTSAQEIDDMGLDVEATEMLVNCPIVPDGSTAKLRYSGSDKGLHSGWYRGKVVKYFTFGEHELSGKTVPVSPIYVAFNKNPDEDGGGPPSGFMSEADSVQTHNVVATTPGDDAYSPLWLVQVYDNADFDSVSDLQSAQKASQKAADVATVNCPIVEEKSK